MSFIKSRSLKINHLRLSSTRLLVVVALVLCSSVADSCAPGRGYGRRRVARPLSPLVYKQHVPNVGEETIAASGSPEGRVARSDPKFSQLVTVDNDDIVFRDEEKTGEDRIMTPVDILINNINC